MPETSAFIGPFKVLAVEILERKTPKGADIVKVSFDTDAQPPLTMPKATFEVMVTDVPKDFNYLRDVRYKKLLETLTAECLEVDVVYSDIAYLGKALVNKMEDAYERTANYLWTGDDKTWIPGVDYRSDRTLLECDEILKKIPPREPKAE